MGVYSVLDRKNQEISMNAETKPETLQFESDATQVLELVTHSLYSKKEIFLRELISNASDALDKLRYEALNDNALYEGEGELKIIVEFDKSACTITLRDNGIGMSKEEVIQNLGTIARSGTKEFLAKLKESDAKTANLIGQFGVGFYSAFVVADKVVVKTRRAGMKEDQGVYWESAGQAGYQIQTITYKPRGTEVILHLKKDEDEFKFTVLKSHKESFALAEKLQEGRSVSAEGIPKFRVVICTRLKLLEKGIGSGRQEKLEVY